MSAVIAGKLFAYVLLPAAGLFLVLRTPRIGANCRGFVGSRIWQSWHPLIACLTLLAGAGSLIWYIWGKERERAHLILLGAESSLFVAMLALWFFSLSFAAPGNRARITRLGTAAVCIAGLLLANAAAGRIGLAK